jgi:hypothetical protein
VPRLSKGDWIELCVAMSSYWPNYTMPTDEQAEIQFRNLSMYRKVEVQRALEELSELDEFRQFAPSLPAIKQHLNRTLSGLTGFEQAQAEAYRLAASPGVRFLFAPETAWRDVAMQRALFSMRGSGIIDRLFRDEDVPPGSYAANELWKQVRAVYEAEYQLRTSGKLPDQLEVPPEHKQIEAATPPEIEGASVRLHGQG